MTDKRITYKSLIKHRPELFDNNGAKYQIITDLQEIEKWQKSKKIYFKDNKKPVSWSKIGVVYDDPYILIIRDLVQFPDGHLGSYFRLFNQADLKGGQGVVVLPYYDGKIVLLYQYRHPIREWSYEVPRGFGEAGISAETQAKNELAEEIGGEASELIDLGIQYNNTGLESNKVKMFFAKLKSFGKPAKAEGIESILRVSLDELEKMISTGKVTDGFTIAAYTKAKLKGLLD